MFNPDALLTIAPEIGPLHSTIASLAEAQYKWLGQDRGSIWDEDLDLPAAWRDAIASGDNLGFSSNFYL